MRWFYLLAGMVCLATGLIHAVTGGIDTLNPVVASTLKMEVRVAMMAVWHSLTVVFFLSTIALFWAFWAEIGKARAVGILLGAFYILFAVLYATLSFLWFEDPMALPQWTLLAPIGLFALLASL